MEILIYDGLEPCPYLPGRVARMPLRFPLARLSPEGFDARLAEGDRRSGRYLYRTRCPACRACEPIRLPVAEFQPNRSQRRVWRRGRAALRVEIGPALADARRVALYNKHRQQRGLVGRSGAIDLDGYASFLTETCCDTFETRYLLGDELVGVAICDRGADSVSAVYCCYDPDHERLALGVFSILNQIEYCRAEKLTYLYLGLYIAESDHMRYKANYYPHERRIGGVWRRFDKGAAEVGESPGDGG